LTNRKQGRFIYFRLNRENADFALLFQWVEARINSTGQADADIAALKEILKIPCEELSRNQRQSGRCTAS
ncbi:MAG: hypothetical protein MI802_13800, partial [Desulfobacterales bacterium]|nr:hypothetical protein [Desulfobacterales bacterium]